MNHNDIEIIEETLAFDGFFQIKSYLLRHRLFKGGWSKPLHRELFQRNPVAAVLPYDPNLDQVVLIEQFRIGALKQDSPWLLELVAGIIEPDEGIEEMAHRETQEEAGLDIKELIPIYQYWTSPGGSSEHLSLFCGIVDASHAGGIFGLAEEEEDIRVSTMPRKEAFAAVQDGRINNSATIIALQWLQLRCQTK